MTDPVDTLSNAPPDWATHITDVLCPLCEYNLRGLTESRCPECGFAFTWREFLDAEKSWHRYLFEYGKGRNFKTFWKTYLRTCLPRKFWTELNPAQPVKGVRLVLYWLIISAMLAGSSAVLKVHEIVKVAQYNREMRKATGLFYYRNGILRVLTPAELRLWYPTPWEPTFWRRLFEDSSYPTEPNFPLCFKISALIASWPVLTVLVMLIFRRSMRRAKIRSMHLLRTAIYSCDFGLAVSVVLAVAFYESYLPDDGWSLITTAMVCAVFTSYRMSIAFDRYLLAHRPLATVLASQLILMLLVVVCLLPFADFSRRI